MYNVLIVDDEERIRIGIKKRLIRFELPIGTIYEGENGIEALEKLKNYKIDIALGETALRVGVPLERLLPRWDREAQEFAEQVRPYLLYK